MNEAQYWAYYNAVRADLVKGASCYYAAKAIHSFAGESRENLQRLNEQGSFWKTTLYGLQAGWFLALSRLFDKGSDTHTIDKFMGHTVAHPEFFSREAFDARRMQGGGVRPDWLDAYVANIWVPTTNDLSEIARMVRPLKQKWRTDYVPIRNQIFAHTIAIDQQGISALYSRTLISEIEGMFQSLYDILEIMNELWDNGHHPNRYQSRQDYLEQIVPDTRELLAELRRNRQ